MSYDDQSKQSQAKPLGKFEIIEQIFEDDWNELFIGLDTTTQELCLVRGFEVCGFGGGIGYEVYTLKNICVKPKDNTGRTF